MNACYIFICDFSLQITRFPYLLEQIHTNNPFLSHLSTFIFIRSIYQENVIFFFLLLFDFVFLFSTHLYVRVHVYFLVEMPCVLLFMRNSFFLSAFLIPASVIPVTLFSFIVTNISNKISISQVLCKQKFLLWLQRQCQKRGKKTHTRTCI